MTRLLFRFHSRFKDMQSALAQINIQADMHRRMHPVLLSTHPLSAKFRRQLT